MKRTPKGARAVVDALIQEIEALVKRGGVRAEDAYALLHKTIDQLPPLARCVLRPEAEITTKKNRFRPKYRFRQIRLFSASSTQNDFPYEHAASNVAQVEFSKSKDIAF
ncbi:hypothetical protein [Roseomonas sp. 18066]|uniref:hypothetical protein n=1 Tax=Roseomonas sp. 18066 TaxID=2681412 RepID=UPI001358AA4C|nr:hypothetical protein [Roseomonas sp. 18066]